MEAQNNTCEDERQEEYAHGHGLLHLRAAGGRQTASGHGVAVLERSGLSREQRIPQEYLGLSQVELDERIGAAKARLGPDLIILGHHYQRDDIIKFADFRGDSFKLSQQAASSRDSRYIVFCGVHFMAETADILSASDQKVILPNLEAGCSMADMADLDSVEECWQAVTGVCGQSVVPVTYMNSAADLKAFCGRHGGAVCTSSNAPSVFRWAFERGERVLFFPDEHLGRNTAVKLEFDQSQVVVWDPRKPDGVLPPKDESDLLRSRVILWKGFCSVHMRFSAEQIRQARQKYPDVNVIVHPECRREVVAAADGDGSTEYIIKVVESAPSGTRWAIGTEVNLVNRLAAENPDKTIFCLNPVVCPCSTMYRIHPAYLLWVMEALVAGQVINQITVGEEDAHWARLALNRMLEIA